MWLFETGVEKHRKGGLDSEGCPWVIGRVMEDGTECSSSHLDTGNSRLAALELGVFGFP